MDKMTGKDKMSSLSAVLGIVLGVLATVLMFNIVNKHNKLNANYAAWQKLNLILQQVDKNYVDTVDVKKVTDAAVTAALASLDPHSIYLPPVDLEKSETELAGNFDGIGIQFNVPNDTAVVLEVIPGGPSEKVGLQPGDRILKVDDRNIAGVKYPQDSMVCRMKGQAGTQVQILVKRGSETIPFNIKRGKIPVHCVDASFMINDTTGYIRLSKFTRATYEEFNASAKSLLDKGMKHLIFDIRDNSGGYFDQALLLADQFLEKDAEIVYLQGLHRAKKNFQADGKGILKDVSLSVLINESSASSSEIFAGAIQDNDRGTIVGRRSYGKGLVQEPIYFTDGSAVRLTVARFYTPSGRCIQKPYSDDYHKITLTVTDKVGHTATQEFDYTYDGTAPRIIITGVEDGETLREPFNMTIGLENEEDEITSIVINGNTIDPASYQADNKYEMQVDQYDTYTVEVTAQDKAGNIATTYDRIASFVECGRYILTSRKV